MRRELALTIAVALIVSGIFVRARSMDAAAKSDVERHATIDTFELHLKANVGVLPVQTVDGII
jgi:hypothetical protein